MDLFACHRRGKETQTSKSTNDLRKSECTWLTWVSSVLIRSIKFKPNFFMYGARLKRTICTWFPIVALIDQRQWQRRHIGLVSGYQNNVVLSIMQHKNYKNSTSMSLLILMFHNIILILYFFWTEDYNSNNVRVFGCCRDQKSIKIYQSMHEWINKFSYQIHYRINLFTKAQAKFQQEQKQGSDLLCCCWEERICFSCLQE